MGNVQVLIVEDSMLIAQGIAATLRKNNFEVCRICDTGETAIEFVRDNKCDLILMDVELAGAMDGISAAQIIRKEIGTPVIYLTDFTDDKTVKRAIKTSPANYLSKPFNEAELIRAIDLSLYNANNEAGLRKKGKQKMHVFLRTVSQVYVKVALSEILYLKAGGAYCDLVTLKESFKFSTSMNHIHEQLGDDTFVRVHRSFVVNIKRIARIDGNTIILDRDHSIQMSKDYRDALLGRVKLIR
jgi:DNA-binding LytR/AlgR family response regulator